MNRAALDACTTLCILLGGLHGQVLKKELAVVVHYERGRKRILDATKSEELRKECERLFASAKGTLLLIVTPRLVQEIRDKESAVEVDYDAVQTFEVRGRKVDFTRLLLPLSGRFSEGVVFYAGSVRTGSSTPEFDALRVYRADGHVYVPDAAASIERILVDLKRLQH